LLFHSEDSLEVISYRMEKTVAKFRDFAEAEKADREFYRKLSGKERLDILLELSKHEPEQRLERVYRVIKLPRR
jgi:hypothetical protein